MIDFQIGNAQSMHHDVHRPMIDFTEKSGGTKILSGSRNISLRTRPAHTLYDRFSNWKCAIYASSCSSTNDRFD